MGFYSFTPNDVQIEYKGVLLNQLDQEKLSFSQRLVYVPPIKKCL